MAKYKRVGGLDVAFVAYAKDGDKFKFLTGDVGHRPTLTNNIWVASRWTTRDDCMASIEHTKRAYGIESYPHMAGAGLIDMETWR